MASLTKYQKSFQLLRLSWLFSGECHMVIFLLKDVNELRSKINNEMLQMNVQDVKRINSLTNQHIKRMCGKSTPKGPVRQRRCLHPFRKGPSKLLTSQPRLMSKTLLKFAIALKKNSHNHSLPGRLISENTKKKYP